MWDPLPRFAGLLQKLGAYTAPSNIVHFILKSIGSTNLGESAGHLDIVDSRTGRKYVIPIENNSINAVDFHRITAASLGADHVDQFEAGLKVLDHGFMNTACMKSSITLMYVFKFEIFLHVDISKPHDLAKKYN
jgi:hypothetical protein